MNRYGIIILAAGASSRMGRPKQLLPYQQKSLIRHIVDAALQLRDIYTVVVTGASDEQVRQELRGVAVHICYNDEWKTGMASSIHKGIKEIIKQQPAIAACIITVCDQPFITTALFDKLIQKHVETGSGIVASAYAGTTGTPVLFARKYFDQLLKLEGAEGAKKLLKVNEADVSRVDFDKGEIDIDTEIDYQRLINPE